MKDWRFTRRSFLKTAGAGALAGLAGGSFPPILKPSHAASKKELRIGYPWDLKNLDPAITTTGGDNAVQANIFDALIGYKVGTTDLTPEAATKWEISEDQQSATFHLRRGIKWHKGYGELKAADVKFHFERILDPQTASTYRGLLGIIKQVDVIDDYALKVVLTKPHLAFIYALSAFRAGHIGSSKAYKELGNDFALNPIGSGPYMFDYWKPRTEYALKANEEYWGGAPETKRIIFYPIPEQMTMFAALKRGDIDLMFIDDTQFFISAQKEPNLKVMRFPSLFMFHLTFNHILPPTNDLKVRQAIAYAINKKEIIEHVLFNLVTSLKCALADGYWGATGEGVNPYDYNPKKARELLKEAGHGGGLKIKAVIPTIQKSPEVYTVVQSNLKEVGIDLEIVTMEFTARTNYVRSEKGRKEFHMSWNPVGPRPPDGDYPMTIFYHSSSLPPGLNHTGYTGIDKYIDAERVEKDPGKRKRIFAEMMRKFADDCAAIPLYSKDYMYTMNKSVEGVNTGPGVGELDLPSIRLIG